MTRIDIISGFLGAGKTTLIQKLLPEVYKDKNIVIVENEFGEIGIDGGFLKEAGIEITEINGGCVCCTLQGDFQEALKKVIDEYNPDYIVIEPSGVGKLSDILAIVKSVEGLELNSYSTVVDAKRCAVYHKNFKEFFDDQIASSSCVILSRTQEVDEDKLQEDVNIIHELNPEARIITTPWSDLSASAIYEAMEGSSDGFPEDLKELEHHHHDHEHCECEDDECECHEHHHHDHDHCECEDDECECHHHHHHDHDEEHEHEHHHHHEHDDEHEHHHPHHHHKHDDPNEGLSEGNRVHVGEDNHHHHHHHHHHHGEHDADEVFDTIGIETINKYSKEEIEEALAKLGDNIVRAKGIVPNEEGSWTFFDYVPGDIDIREGHPAYTGLITVIGVHVDVNEMKEIFKVK